MFLDRHSGKRLAQLRRTYGESIDLPNLRSAVFASLLGISAIAYSSYERGERESKVDFLVALRKKTGVCLDGLMDLSQAEPNPMLGWGCQSSGEPFPVSPACHARPSPSAVCYEAVIRLRDRANSTAAMQGMRVNGGFFFALLNSASPFVSAELRTGCRGSFFFSFILASLGSRRCYREGLPFNRAAALGSENR
jgi:transcriptional regulator with XRE-family HTH domain